MKIDGSYPDLEVYKTSGVKVPMECEKEQLTKHKYDFNENKWVAITRDTVYYSIRLRSKYSHILILKYEGKEELIELYPKVGFGWFILDMITGVLPGIFGKRI